MRILRLIFRLLTELYLGWIRQLPMGLGYTLRRRYYSKRFKSCGRNLTIGIGVIIESPELMVIGNDVHIDHYCILSSSKNIQGNVRWRANRAFTASPGQLLIGDNVHIVHTCILMAHGGIAIADRCTLSAGTKIYSLSNLSQDPDSPSKRISIMPYSQAPFLQSPVVLEENVWLGISCIIMPGTCVGRDSFVVSQSLVLGEFKPNSKLKGSPAKRVGNRYPGHA